MEKPLAAKEYLLAARGFSCLLWSVPLGFLLLSGALQFVSSTRLPVPAYVLAALLFIYGLLLLKRIPMEGAAWRLRIRIGFAQGLLLCYFAPFLVWWRWQPYQDHFILNVLALFLTYCATLHTINRLSAEWAEYCQARVLQIEARLAGWAIWFCIIAPLVIMLIIAGTTAHREGISILAVLESLRHMRHLQALLVILLLPLTLTMGIAWKAKEQAMRQIISQEPPSWKP